MLFLRKQQPPLTSHNNHSIIMKNLFIVFLVPLAFPLISIGQEELEEKLSDLIEQHEERKFYLQELEFELEDAKSDVDHFGEALLETEIEGLSDWIRQNADSLEELSQIIESQDLEGEGRESSFDSAIERHHRRNQLHELEFQSRLLEVELQLHVEEGEEEAVDRLESKVDHLSERIEKTKKIHAEWERVEAARKAGDHEKAEELGHALWIEEKELALQVELAGRKLEVVDNQQHADDLREEGQRVEKILVLSSEMQKQAELRVGEWKRLKKKLKNSDEEERHELIEEYHLSEEIFQLRKEITNLRKELVFAEDEFEAEELNSIIDDLEQEMSELEEQSD